MTTAQIDGRPVLAELRLRRFTEEDRHLIDEEADPELVLTFTGPDGDWVESYPFGMDSQGVHDFARDQIKTLAHRRFTQPKFGAEAGDVRRDLLRRVMLEGRKIVEDALTPEDLVRLNQRLDSLPENATIRVDTEISGPDFPWGLLHPAEVPKTHALTLDGLLGYRFTLVMPIQGSRTSLSASEAYTNVWLEGAVRRYGFVDDPSLPSVRRKIERRALAQHTGPGFDPLHHLSLEGEEQDDDLSHEGIEDDEEVVDYLTRRARAAIHLACHGRTRGGAGKATQYSITIRRNYEITAAKLRKAIAKRGGRALTAAGGAGSPFLFLNLCSSAAEHDRPGRDAASALEGLGAEALVGTLGAVCDRMASDLAARFYEVALQPGREVGDAYLQVVRQGLSNTLNPAHLLFVFKGRPDVVIA